MFGAGTAALLATAGCNPFSTPPRVTQTMTVALPPTADPVLTLIATTRLHLVRLSNAITTQKTLAARLTPLRNDRQAHLSALIKELARTSPQGAAAENTRPTADASITVPKTAAQVLVVLRSDATAAQAQFTDSFDTASRYRAALFGSIIACLSTHREVMS